MNRFGFIFWVLLLLFSYPRGRCARPASGGPADLRFPGGAADCQGILPASSRIQVITLDGVDQPRSVGPRNSGRGHVPCALPRDVRRRVLPSRHAHHRTRVAHRGAPLPPRPVELRRDAVPVQAFTIKGPMNTIPGSPRSRFAVAAAVVVLAAVLGSQPVPREQVGPLPGGGFLLNSGWKLDPVGKQLPLSTLPMSTTLSPDGKYLLVLNGGYRPPSISVIEIAGARVVSTDTGAGRLARSRVRAAQRPALRRRRVARGHLRVSLFRGQAHAYAHTSGGAGGTAQAGGLHR